MNIRWAGRLTSAIAMMLLFGCAGGDPIQTTSGKPDVVMRGVDRTCFKEAVLNGLLTGGWSVRTVNDLQLVVQRRAPPSFATAMMTTGYGPPEQRLSITMAPSGADLRLVIDLAVISNAGTGFERVQPVQATAQDQQTTEALARRAEIKCGKG